jgi:protoporphyrinogen oxidase
VLEAAPQVGGLATWFDYGEFVWDKYYHVICAADEHLIGLIRELGLESRLRFATTRTGFLWEGRHLSMSNNREFLTFPALSLLDKARLAAGILYCQRVSDPAPLERIKAADWLRRIFGGRVYRVIWEPLLESKYGVLKDEMPATIMWATIRRYYTTRDKKGGKEQLGFMSGGLRTLFEGLTRHISDAGGEILTGSPVLAIRETEHDTVTVRTAERTLEFDRVISTLPTALGEKLAEEVAWADRAPRSKPRFLGVLCLALVLRRPLNPFYVINLIQKGFPFTGIIGVSNLTGPEELGGRHLAILPRYDVPGSPYFERSLEELTGEFLEALRPFWPDIRQNVVSCHLNRERMVQALWIDGPPPLHGPVKSASGKVWVVNAELTGRDTLNNNAIVRVANQAAADFLAAGNAAGSKTELILK